MDKSKGFITLFKRDRRCGDLVFAVLFLFLAIFLLTQLGEETKWVKRTKLFAQPAFWPTVSLIGMAFFAFLHFLGSVCSKRIPGRMVEVFVWIRSIEYALWFLIYVWTVPIIGYLLSTLLFIGLLNFRLGYRDPKVILSALATGFAVVVVFKSFLQVKIPGGQIYEYLPNALRNFMLLNF
jgi:hypothetical protein